MAMLIKRFALGTGLATALLIGVLAVNSARFNGPVIGDGSELTIAPGPDFDAAQAAEKLGEAIRFRTISQQNVAANDWSQWGDLRAWLERRFPAMHGAMTREIVGQGSLLFRWAGSDPTLPAIIVMAHHDVVPVTPGTESDWTHPPFDGVVADGRVWGRGALDDKGSLVALCESLDLLARAGFTPRRDIYLVSGHDEEVGGAGARAVAALLKQRGVRAQFTLDEGGVVLLDAPVSGTAAALVGVAEKGYATLSVTAMAPGGHSSMPPNDSGVVTLARAVLAINDNGFPIELSGPSMDMLSALAAQKGGLTRLALANSWLLGGRIRRQMAASPVSAASFRTTIAPTMLTGSPKENVLPQSAQALINYRIAPWNSAPEVMDRARRAVGDLPVDLAWVSEPREPTPVSSATSAGWSLVAASARAVLDGPAANAPVLPYLVVGGTDARSFSGISDDVYRFLPVQVSNAETRLIHGTDEQISIDNLGRMIGFYTRLLKAAAG